MQYAFANPLTGKRAWKPPANLPQPSPFNRFFRSTTQPPAMNPPRMPFGAAPFPMDQRRVGERSLTNAASPYNMGIPDYTKLFG